MRQIAPYRGAPLIVGVAHRVLVQLLFHTREAVDAGDIAIAIVGHRTVHAAGYDDTLDVGGLHHVQKRLSVALLVLVRLFPCKNQQSFAVDIGIEEIVLMCGHALAMTVHYLDLGPEQMVRSRDLKDVKAVRPYLADALSAGQFDEVGGQARGDLAGVRPLLKARDHIVLGRLRHFP